MLNNLEYLSYPLPPDIRRMSEAGDFVRMEKVIADRLNDPCVPKCLHDRLRFELEIARLTPRYYPYSKAELMTLLREKVPDITDEEIEALRDDGTLDWRYINGEVRYRTNCIAALLKVKKDVAAREIGEKTNVDTKRRHGNLDEVIRRQMENGHLKMRFELHE